MINEDIKSEYELFYDEGYYGFWCVRNVNDKRFNSPMSFHFSKKEDAETFVIGTAIKQRSCRS